MKGRIAAFYSTKAELAKGQNEFEREAQKASACWTALGYAVLGIPIDTARPMPERKKQVIGELRKLGDEDQYPVHLWAFFGHGWASGFQFGFSCNDVAQLAKVLTPLSEPCKVRAAYATRVALYCCLTGSSIVRALKGGDDPAGDGGFADRLRDALAEALAEGHVDCHTTAGHTTKNPNLRRMKTPAGRGGAYIVSPSNKELCEKLRAALQTDFRFRFPLLTTPEILGELA